MTLFSGSFRSPHDYYKMLLPVEWLKSLLTDSTYACGHPRLVASPGPYLDDLEILLRRLKQADEIGDQVVLEGLLDQTLAFFQNLYPVLGGDSSYCSPTALHIAQMAMRFLPIFATAGAYYVYNLLEAIHWVTAHDTAILRRLVEDLRPQEAEELKIIGRWQFGDTLDFFAEKLISILHDLPADRREQRAAALAQGIII